MSAKQSGRSLPRWGTQMKTILCIRGFASKISARLTTLSGGTSAEPIRITLENIVPEDAIARYRLHLGQQSTHAGLISTMSFVLG